MDEEKFHLGIKALIMNDKNQILLLKANPKNLKGNTPEHWDLPGGRVERSSTIEETLFREIREELGIKSIDIVDQFDVFISNMKIPLENESVGLILLVFTCKLNYKSDFTLGPEHLEYRWFNIDDAKKLLKLKYPESFIQKLDSLK